MLAQVKYHDAESRTLAFLVYDYDRFTAGDMVGQVLYPLQHVDLTVFQLEWRDIHLADSDDDQVHVHRVRKKKVWSISGVTSSNTDRFLKFFHYYNLQEI